MRHVPTAESRAIVVAMLHKGVTDPDRIAFRLGITRRVLGNHYKG